MARIKESGFRLQASGFRLQASGFRLQASGFRLQASGFRLLSVRGGAKATSNALSACRLSPFLPAASFKDSASTCGPRPHAAGSLSAVRPRAP
ncbi:hypothetical protein CXK97_07700 [Stutzerimonas stutzeri]|nr:hypothetical protein CXK97_07700 [Stutzerimonas stutzeri]